MLSSSNDPFLNEATDAAKRSVSDPRVFLRYERALGTSIGTSERLLVAFTQALESLESFGVLATLDMWCERTDR